MEIEISKDQAKAYLECMDVARTYYEGVIIVCYTQLGETGIVRGSDLHNRISHAQLKVDSITTEIETLERKKRRARGGRSGKQGVKKNKDKRPRKGKENETKKATSTQED
jgi:hypothetical protein